ncbi:hypothetical protein ACQR1W_01860 [Bradyrhizobium sp. HKCCYLS1011]|uniref:hypothetical protein n=1 Tax=Bradyrhizobium sp. HKCCYLS1011 TaxID=3420733 RepID=UPI003EBA3678
MTNGVLTDEQLTVYQEYRVAMKHLKSGRDFSDWMKIARGYDQARSEAMRRAGTNVPQGATYREEFARIEKREKLIDRDQQGTEFPSKEDRTYCIKVLENYDTPSLDPRRKSIKEWRATLPSSEAAKLNHPKRVWMAYWQATEPRAEKDAKRAERAMREPKQDKMLEAVGQAEAETHAARRETESLRELLGYIRDHVQLPGDVAVRIDAALRGL